MYNLVKVFSHKTIETVCMLSQEITMEQNRKNAYSSKYYTEGEAEYNYVKKNMANTFYFIIEKENIPIGYISLIVEENVLILNKLRVIASEINEQLYAYVHDEIMYSMNKLMLTVLYTKVPRADKPLQDFFSRQGMLNISEIQDGLAYKRKRSDITFLEALDVKMKA